MMSRQEIHGATAAFLGVSVHLLSTDELTDSAVRLVSSGRVGTIIANHNLHSLYLVRHNPDLHRFYKLAEVTYVDGMSLVALGRLFGEPMTRRHRTTNVDWAPRVFQIAADRQWRVAYLGSTPEVASKSVNIIAKKYPALQYFAHHGHFDATQGSKANTAVLEWIASIEPHLLYVGMGMPRQELWIWRNIHEIRANVIMPAGAYLDYLASAIPTPPRWLSRLGLEWLARLGAEPRRLGRRYLFEPVALVPSIVKELLKRHCCRPAQE